MEKSGIIINPVREHGEAEVPVCGLLLVNPAEAEKGFRLAGDMGGESRFLFNSRLSVVPAAGESQPFFVAGPAVGAPMAVLALEKLIVLGARRVIAYGWCGSLSETLRTGDVLLPTWAESSDGTSGHYPTEVRPESHDQTRESLNAGLSQKGFAVKCGPVWTTDAPYRESIDQVKRLGGQGVLGVDMEFGALAAVAAFRGVGLAAVMLVSDELWSGTWNPGFKTKGFRQRSRELLSILMKYCQAGTGK